MQHSLRAIFSIILVGWVCFPSLAAETGRTWWPFGQSPDTGETLPPAADQFPAATASNSTENQPTLPSDSLEEPEPRWMFSSPFAKVSWPRLQMPELPKPALPASPWASKPEAGPNRNSWAEPEVVAPQPSPMRRFGQRTRAAWDKTVDALTPGDQSQSNDPSSRVARRDEPSMWSRMFGSNEPKKKEGSQTIGEFIAQDRVDP